MTFYYRDHGRWCDLKGEGVEIERELVVFHLKKFCNLVRFFFIEKEISNNPVILKGDGKNENVVYC